jgi:hypothetical protein
MLSIDTTIPRSNSNALRTSFALWQQRAPRTICVEPLLLRNWSLRLERLGLTSGIEIVGQFFYARRGCENGCGDCMIVFWLNDQGCGSEAVEVSEISRAAIRKSLFQSSSKLDLEGKIWECIVEKLCL